MNKSMTAILGAGLFARLLMLLVLTITTIPQFKRMASGGDAIGYTQLALSLLHENTLKFAAGNPTAYRMPGYPLFLALLYGLTKYWLSAQIVQILVDVFTIWLVYKTAENVSSNRVTPVIAAVIMLTNPLLILSSVLLLPETLSVCLMALVLFALIRFRDLSWTNVLVPIILGLSIYLKPTMFLIAIALLTMYVVYHFIKTRAPLRTANRAVLSISILVVLLMPWIVRNYVVMGAFIPLTTSNGSNLYGGNNPQANGGYVSSEPYVLPGMSEIESDRLFRERAVNWIQLNPRDFIALLPAKAIRLFWPLSLGTSGNVSVPTVIFWGVLCSVLAFYVLVLLGVWSLSASRRYWKAVVLITIPVGLLFLSLIAFGAARFYLPAFPAFAVLGSIGVEYAMGKVRRVQVVLEQDAA